MTYTEDICLLVYPIGNNAAEGEYYIKYELACLSSYLMNCTVPEQLLCIIHI